MCVNPQEIADVVGFTENILINFLDVSYSSKFAKIGICHKSYGGAFTKFEKALFCSASLDNYFYIYYNFDLKNFF